MTALLLALTPLLFALGFLTWTMLMGAREQKRSDTFADDWMSKQRPTVRKPH